MPTTQRKIILVANTDWYLYNFRLSLARELRNRGWEVILVSPGGRFVSPLKAEGFQWMEWRLNRRTFAPWNELAAFLAILRIYRRARPDLVHHFTIKPVLYGSLSARLANIPAVVNSITGLGYLFLQKDLTARILRQAALLLYRPALQRECTRVIFENESDRHFFIGEGLVRAEDSVVIEGVGVDVERFKPSPEPGGPIVVVLPARLLWDKGVGDLVEAARQLNLGGNVRICLVGEPDPGNPATVEQTDLERWQAEGLVELWGFQANMADVYAKCHIVCLPSHGEGLPTALIEGAACARPIVTTDVPGCRDVVTHGKNGLVVSPSDPVALANGLRTLVDNPEMRQKMGAAGRQMVLQRFSNERILSETLAAYNQVLP
jgi:glycosyltransferase involved in cell wall biosynthesis